MLPFIALLPFIVSEFWNGTVGVTACAYTGGSFCPHITPEIYKTDNSNTIVKEEFLFIYPIIIQIFLLALNSFLSEQSMNMLQSVQRCILHKGQQKDINNIKVSLKVPNIGLFLTIWMSFHLLGLAAWTFQSWLKKLSQEVFIFS